MNFQTYCLKHRPEAREIGEALNFLALDIPCGIVPRADEPHIQLIGKFLSDIQTGTARVTLDEALAASADIQLLNIDELDYDEEGRPLLRLRNSHEGATQ